MTSSCCATVARGLDYLRSQRDLAEQGLYLELKAYETQAYLELRDVRDTDGRWRRLAAQLGGRGVPSIDEAMRDLDLAPLHDALRSNDRAAAVREAAELLGVAEPAAPVAEAATESRPAGGDIADAVEKLVAANRPELREGRLDRRVASRARAARRGPDGRSGSRQQTESCPSCSPTTASGARSASTSTTA